mgnify:CR=1 FL=1
MFKLFSISLYFVSFLPLWVSVIFIDILSIVENQVDRGTEYVSICCILIAMIVSITVIYHEIHKHGKEGSTKQIIKAAREEKSITAEFLLSYILPLFAFDFTLWNQVVLFLIFFITLGYLCIRHNYYSVNIMLEIAGYRFFQCNLLNSDNVITEQLIMSKQRLNALIGTDIYVVALNNEYRLDVSKMK